MCLYHMGEALYLQSRHLAWFRGFPYQKTKWVLIELRKFLINTRSESGQKKKIAFTLD